jgi:FMN phosphatase YigB (HAD superfamily)
MTRRLHSYDVFDTIVTRAFAHPRDLFVHLGTRLHRLGLHRLAPMDFAQIRWNAELAARRASPWTEVLLDDIYRELAASMRWDPPTAETARRVELEIESQHLRGIPVMRAQLAAARLQSGPLLFLSDMYLPSAILRPWLEREGVVAAGDLLLISGEVRGNKSSGQLFTAARDRIGADFSAWEHTGDHHFADVEKPRQLGITTRHFTAAHLTPRERAARGTEGEFAPEWRSLLAGAMRLARLERTAETEREAVLWDVGTSVAGPLFYGFVRWALEEAARRGLRRLYFLARDGQVFLRIAQAIQGNEPGPIACRYLHGSRLVFTGPAELADATALREMAMPRAHFHSLRQTLRQLGLDTAQPRLALPDEFAALNPDANLAPEVRTRLADWLLAPERRPAIRSALERRARTARAYLTSQGLTAGEPAGVVDAGWHGTIQRNLEIIIGDGRPVSLTGFYIGLKPLEPPATAGERLGYTNRFAPLPLNFDESHKVLVELLAQSDHGQVTAFETAGRNFTPVLHDLGPVNLDEIRLMQEAILAFARRMNETIGEAECSTGEFARAVIGLYREFHDHPTRREAGIFGFMPHADQAFEQRHATLCASPGLAGTWAAIVDYQRRPPHWWVYGQTALGQRPLLSAFIRLRRLKWRLFGRHE